MACDGKYPETTPLVGTRPDEKFTPRALDTIESGLCGAHPGKPVVSSKDYLHQSRIPTEPRRLVERELRHPYRLILFLPSHSSHRDGGRQRERDERSPNLHQGGHRCQVPNESPAERAAQGADRNEFNSHLEERQQRRTRPLRNPLPTSRRHRIRQERSTRGSYGCQQCRKDFGSPRLGSAQGYGCHWRARLSALHSLVRLLMVHPSFLPHVAPFWPFRLAEKMDVHEPTTTVGEAMVVHILYNIL